MDTDFTFDIFLEHLGHASIIPFISDITLQAMQLFGGYEIQTSALVALAGLLIGCALNWLIGQLLLLVRSRVTFLGAGSFTAAEQFFHRYGWMACALFFMPLGVLIPVIAGFLRTPFWKVMLASAVGALFELREYLFT